MDKGIFKVGDRVFDLVYGWGKVIDSICPITVEFSEYTVGYYKKDLVKLSFTEYTLQGFTQERPIKLPEVGELCLVRNCGGLNWHVASFLRYDKNEFICSQEHRWDEFKRIKILD